MVFLGILLVFPLSGFFVLLAVLGGGSIVLGAQRAGFFVFAVVLTLFFCGTALRLSEEIVAAIPANADRELRDPKIAAEMREREEWDLKGTRERLERFGASEKEIEEELEWIREQYRKKRKINRLN